MVKTHPERFGDAFWAYFAEQVAPHLPPRPIIVDLGCGPGLFLRDLGERCAPGALVGYDVTPAMIAHARQLAWREPTPVLEVHDVAAQPLPLADGTVHLVGMSSVLHIIEEPLPVLADVRRVLAPGGVFLLHDWIRQPLETYLAWRRDVMGESEPESLRRGFRLFPAHNKYTAADWQWVLARAGFVIRHQTQFRASHWMFVTTAAPA
jgi:SAM-dependent methyltransferase